jgi:hypothetical protein
MRRKVVVEVGFEMVDIFKHLYLSSGATWRIRIVKTERRKKDRANYSSDRAIMHREDSKTEEESGQLLWRQSSVRID